MRSANDIYVAFSGAPRPSAPEIPDIAPNGDLEREEIRDLLAPHSAREVPSEDLRAYPLHTMFSFLSAASYRYYMPRFIEHSLEDPDSLLSESLLFSLARFNDDRIASFSIEERAVVMEYLKHLATQPDAHIVASYISSAEEQWA